MKKIDGTLYSPIKQPNGERNKMYVETVPEAVIFDDGSTLQDKLNNIANPIVISSSKPTKESLWIKPDGINPDTYFNFSDVNVTPSADSTPVHTLKSPANEDGIRDNVYPITDAKGVHVTNTKNINDVLSNYDMGFAVGRQKPDFKSFWGNEVYQTVTITDLGKEEEVILMNDFFGSKVKINDTTYNAPNFVFTIDGQKMVFFDPDSDIVSKGDTIPNKGCFWIDTLYSIYPTNPDIGNFLLDSVVIDETEYKSTSDKPKIIKYNNSDWVFFDPSKFIISETVPKVHSDTFWADTDV